jgi:CspA family cold shock protein
MKKGIVKSYDESNGFGFIAPEDGSEHVFVTKQNLKSGIKKDDKVEFETVRGSNGLNAEEVQKI